eukprot:359416-Chlamydomonas_euryale.AAC.4
MPCLSHQPVLQTELPTAPATVSIAAAKEVESREGGVCASISDAERVRATAGAWQNIRTEGRMGDPRGLLVESKEASNSRAQRSAVCDIVHARPVSHVLRPAFRHQRKQLLCQRQRKAAQSEHGGGGKPWPRATAHALAHRVQLQRTRVQLAARRLTRPTAAAAAAAATYLVPSCAPVANIWAAAAAVDVGMRASARCAAHGATIVVPPRMPQRDDLPQDDPKAVGVVREAVRLATQHLGAGPLRAVGHAADTAARMEERRRAAAAAAAVATAARHDAREIEVAQLGDELCGAAVQQHIV